MRRQLVVVGTAVALCLGAQVGGVPEAPARASDAASDPAPAWRVARSEDFTTALSVNGAAWVKDPQTATSRWAVDQFDDNGKVWHAISDPAMTRQLRTMNVYRKRVAFGVRRLADSGGRRRGQGPQRPPRLQPRPGDHGPARRRARREAVGAVVGRGRGDPADQAAAARRTGWR